MLYFQRMERAVGHFNLEALTCSDGFPVTTSRSVGR